jgi:hypothetical protein
MVRECYTGGREMSKLADYINKLRVAKIPQRTRNNPLPQLNEHPDENIRLKSKPVVETPVEFDYELYKSNWPDLFDGYLDHVIEDMKGGNLEGVQEMEVNHYLKCATMCATWHPNPKNRLLRAKALFVSDAATLLGVSMSRKAKFFDGIRTVREKKKEQREMTHTGNNLVPWGKKKENEDDKW